MQPDRFVLPNIAVSRLVEDAEILRPRVFAIRVVTPTEAPEGGFRLDIPVDLAA